ncbi:putative endonuclease or glycosyl hydrolase [Raphanus sativus]|nr:putative endonuclease or glycosyl hydrolase [Raphanus sativus]
MAGGGDALLQKQTGVWWDLNTCPVPAGVEPRRVRECIESALYKEMGYRSQVHIYAFGNLEYMPSALLEEISSSGIVVSHAPCGGNSLSGLLDEWSEDNPTPATIVGQLPLTMCHTIRKPLSESLSGKIY